MHLQSWFRHISMTALTVVPRSDTNEKNASATFGACRRQQGGRCAAASGQMDGGSLLGIMNNFVSEPFGETYDLLAFPIGDRERLQCCAQMSAKSIPIRHRNGEVVMG